MLFVTYVAGNACTLGKTREEASADGRAFLGILCFKHDNDKYLVATNFRSGSGDHVSAAGLPVWPAPQCAAIRDRQMMTNERTTYIHKNVVRGLIMGKTYV